MKLTADGWKTDQAFQTLTKNDLDGMYGSWMPRVLVDVKHLFPKNQFTREGYLYWGL